jgi:hypothetical protein
LKSWKFSCGAGSAAGRLAGPQTAIDPKSLEMMRRDAARTLSWLSTSTTHPALKVSRSSTDQIDQPIAQLPPSRKQSGWLIRKLVDAPGENVGIPRARHPPYK